VNKNSKQIDVEEKEKNLQGKVETTIGPALGPYLHTSTWAPYTWVKKPREGSSFSTLGCELHIVRVVGGIWGRVIYMLGKTPWLERGAEEVPRASNSIFFEMSRLLGSLFRGEIEKGIHLKNNTNEDRVIPANEKESIGKGRGDSRKDPVF